VTPPRSAAGSSGSPTQGRQGSLKNADKTRPATSVSLRVKANDCAGHKARRPRVCTRSSASATQGSPFSAGQASYHREPADVRTDRCAGRSSARARKRPRQNASSMTWGKQPHRTSFRSPVPSPHDRFGRARAACHAVANRERDADTEPIRRETGRPYFSRSTAKAEPQASSRVSDYSSALSRSTPGQVTTATPGTSPWASCQA